MKRLTGLTLSGILFAGAGVADAPRVVTDIAPVHSLVAQVMEGAGTPDLLVPPGVSPHAYAMRPSEARALSRADVVFWIGPSLTPWLEAPVETLSGSARHEALTEVPGVVLLPFREGDNFEGHDHSDDHAAEGHDDHGHDDHDDDHADAAHDEHDHTEAHSDKDHDAHHDDEKEHDEHDHAEDHTEAHNDHGDTHAGHDDHAHHGTTDPHLWLDPVNALAWLQHISAVLSAQDPENASLYAANAEKSAAALLVQQQAITAQLAPYADIPFVVFHDAYHYFEARFGVSAVAAITLADAGAASAGRLAEVRASVRRTGAACALNDPASGEGLIDAVSSEDGLRIMTADPVGAGLNPGTGFYTVLLQQIADALSDCLGGA
ncbi:zinc ABC transporter substrate-binding protein [uncultured Roseobacter sp.]|uniref:zinc ABC transporter substrate-binding protein n=1 Tax=uncultured Roseobacter sp. TaxID=114847 RepID=UPI00262C203D|nr:zinc ABC transporter substrate-binding protein [uncultured Roseobacter sp.]